MSIVSDRLQHVRDALDRASNNLTPAQWKELLGELDADVTGHLDALRDEAGEQ
jgi:hypothetical protein